MIRVLPGGLKSLVFCQYQYLVLLAACWQLPDHGVYEFDFVTARRPSSRTKPMHSLAYYRLLKNAGVYDLLVRTCMWVLHSLHCARERGAC